MSSFNKVILLGNLTRDLEVRVTPSGVTVGKFGLAVNRKFTTRDGEQREEVTFLDVDVFGKQAETLAKYVRKGSPLFLEGRLKLDQWETSDGQKRSKLGIVLESFQFVGGGSGSADRSESRGSTTAPGGDTVLEEEPPF